jgi:integrase
MPAVAAPRNVTATADERNKLIAAAAPHLRCWLLLCSDLAMRSGTAAKIAPRHYDAARGTLTFSTKKGREMCLPITAELEGMLRPLANADAATPFVCLLHRNGRIHVENLRAAMRRLMKRLGINRRIIAHDLRRTTAVQVYEGSHDLRLVQAVLGHRHLASTLHYLDHRMTKVGAPTLELAKLNPHTEVIQ